MSNPSELIKAVRSNIEENQVSVDANGIHTGGEWEDSEILRWLNRADLHITKKIIETDEQHFEFFDTSLGYVTDQQEYDISAINGGRISKVTNVERTDLALPKPLIPVIWQDRALFEKRVVLSLINVFEERFYIRGNFLGIAPPPDVTVAGNIRLAYVTLPAEMHIGLAADGTSTTITFSSSPLIGNLISHATDYYKNSIIEITSGNGAGQRRTVSAYNRSTRVATVSTAWDTIPNATSKYEVIPQTPEQYHELLELYATLAALSKDDQNYVQHEKRYNLILEEMVNTIRDRQTQNSREVRYIQDDLEFY